MLINIFLLVIIFLGHAVILGGIFLYNHMLVYVNKKWFIYSFGIFMIIIFIVLNIHFIFKLKEDGNTIWYVLYFVCDIVSPILLIIINRYFHNPVQNDYSKLMNKFTFLDNIYKNYLKNKTNPSDKFLDDDKYRSLVLEFNDLIERIKNGEEVHQLDSCVLLTSENNNFKSDVEFQCPYCKNYLKLLKKKKCGIMVCDSCCQKIIYERQRKFLFIIVVLINPYYTMTFWYNQAYVVTYNAMSILAEMNKNFEDAIIYLKYLQDWSEKLHRQFPEDKIYQNFLNEKASRLLLLKSKLEKEKELLSKK